MAMISEHLTRKEWLEKMFLRSKSENSRRMGQKVLSIWDKFLKEKFPNINEAQILNEVRTGGEMKKYRLIDQVVLFMINKSLAPRTILIYGNLLKQYFRSQGIKLEQEEFKEFVTKPKIPKKKRYAITKDEIKKLIQNAQPKYKAIFLICVSSGMRIGEVVQLQKRDFEIKPDIIKVNVRAETTLKTAEDRETYISLEAWNYVKPYYEKTAFDNTYLFIDSYHKNTVQSIEDYFNTLRRHCGFIEKYDNGRNYKVNIHCFRGFFHTKATLTHDEYYANALDGHSAYLEQYYRITDQERDAMYKKLEPSLKVF